ncbi:MAG: nuclear transport factor 2 family protein [Actinomycetota bacterium]
MTRHPEPGAGGAQDAVALYQRWITELWAGKTNARELVSADFVGHWPTRDVHGPEELQAIVDDTRKQLRELMFVIDVGPIVDGDLVAARWISTGAARSGPARFTGNDILRLADGKIVEYWTGTTPA